MHKSRQEVLSSREQIYSSSYKLRRTLMHRTPTEASTLDTTRSSRLNLTALSSIAWGNSEIAALYKPRELPTRIRPSTTIRHSEREDYKANLVERKVAMRRNQGGSLLSAVISELIN
jgi:hypothetical protein